MPGLLIKELPKVLHRKLKERAKIHHRSMTKEALTILQKELQKPLEEQLMPTPIKGRFRLTQEFIDEAKSEGRA